MNELVLIYWGFSIGALDFFGLNTNSPTTFSSYIFFPGFYGSLINDCLKTGAIPESTFADFTD